MKALIPLTRDPVSLSILETVDELARLVPGVQIHLLTVIDPRSVHGVLAGREVTSGATGTLYVSSPLPRVVESHGDALARIESETLETLAGIAATRLARPGATPHVRFDEHPARAIVRLADELDADLIVMATNGRAGVSQLVLGSVTAAVIRDSGRPVLVRRTVGPAT